MNYQYVDIPNLDEISEQVLHKIPEFHKDNSSCNFKNCDKNFFKEIKILKDFIETLIPWDEITHTAIVCTGSKSRLPIHVDRHPDKVHQYALNIPVYNCLNTYTIFYKIRDRNKFNLSTDLYYGKNPKTQYSYFVYDQSDVEEIDRLYLNKAAFFNHQIPHSAVNDTNEPRIVLSIRSVHNTWKGITHEYN